MAEKHPYMSGTGGLVQTVSHLRRSFPPQVTADTLKKLGIAANNETYVLNILRFVGVLDSENKESATAAGVFNKHDDAEFQVGFAKLVSTAYADLFGLHGDAAWSLPTDKLISYFRNTDHTSAIVGLRQATTFQGLATLSGMNDGTVRASAPKVKKAEKSASKVAASKPISNLQKPRFPNPDSVVASIGPQSDQRSSGMALTVRVEINLPAGGDQETYDRIFKSIRENLLNGNVS